MNEKSQDEMGRWYGYAAEQQGFIGFALRKIRESRTISIEDQQKAFGTDAEGFCRLQAMPMPRVQKYTADAYRIAEACQLLNPMAFVNAMLLVKSINNFYTKPEPRQYYQAAFDSVEGLDDDPEGD